MQILIVDDEPLARERIREMLKSEKQIENIAEAANGGEALKNIDAHIPDILFLDIQMPDMNGFGILASLDKEVLQQIPVVIFVTAYDEYALRAFEFHALDYLLKPFDRKRFADAFRRAKQQLRQTTGDEHQQQQILNLLGKINAVPEYLEWLTIKKDERILLLKVAEVYWAEAQGNYVLLKFKDNSHLLRETMDNLESQLDPRTFVRIHRSTIVNINQIKELQVWSPGEYRVMMQSGRAFTLSRGYRHRLNAFLKKHSL